MLILLRSVTLPRKLQVKFLGPYLDGTKTKLKERKYILKFIHFIILNRGCVCSWPNLAVPVPGLSRNKFPGGSLATKLHGRASGVSEDGILASGGGR